MAKLVSQATAYLAAKLEEAIGKQPSCFSCLAWEIGISKNNGVSKEAALQLVEKIYE